MAASNDLIYTTLLEIKGEIGAVKTSVANNHEFTQAVSAKADRLGVAHVAALEAHKVDTEPHPQAASAAGNFNIARIVAAVAVAELVGHWLMVKH